MKPSVGRIVHALVPPSGNNGAPIAPAIITRVWSDDVINIRVFSDGSTGTPLYTSIRLFEDQAAAEAWVVEQTSSEWRPVAAFWPPRV
jgi:hypothetical protein